MPCTDPPCGAFFLAPNCPLDSNRTSGSIAGVILSKGTNFEIIISNCLVPSHFSVVLLLLTATIFHILFVSSEALIRSFINAVFSLLKPVFQNSIWRLSFSSLILSPSMLHYFLLMLPFFFILVWNFIPLLLLSIFFSFFFILTNSSVSSSSLVSFPRLYSPSSIRQNRFFSIYIRTFIRRWSYSWRFFFFDWGPSPNGRCHPSVFLVCFWQLQNCLGRVFGLGWVIWTPISPG